MIPAKCSITCISGYVKVCLLHLQDKAGEAQGAAKDTYNQAGSKASELGSKAQVRSIVTNLSAEYASKP